MEFLLGDKIEIKIGKRKKAYFFMVMAVSDSYLQLRNRSVYPENMQSITIFNHNNITPNPIKDAIKKHNSEIEEQNNPDDLEGVL